MMKKFKQTLRIITLIIAVMAVSVMAAIAAAERTVQSAPRITVRFIPGEGAFTDDVSGVYTGVMGFRIDSFPEPVPPWGYYFVGWFAYGAQLHPPIAAVRNISIVAAYAPIPDPDSVVSFAIVYDPAPGQLPQGAPPIQSFTYGSPLTNLPIPSHTGYIYNGWIWNDEPVIAPFIIRSDMILEAMWTPASDQSRIQPILLPPAIPPFHFVVAFNPFPGAFTGDETGLRFGRNFSTLRDMPESPVRQGYIFDGWRLPNGSPLNDLLVVRDDIMLTAIWNSSTESGAATTTSTIQVEIRPNPQTSPLVVSVMIFIAVTLLGLTAFGIFRLCTGQATAAGKYQAAMVRYVREIRILIKSK